MIAVAGLDPLRFLKGTDRFEARVMQRVAARTLELQSRLDENRAVMIANAVGKMLGGGK